MLHSPYTCIYIIIANVVWVMRALDCSSSNALQRLGTPEVTLKPEKRSAIVKFACSCLPIGFGKVSMLPDASVCFESTSGKCAAGSSVVVAISRHLAASSSG